MEFENRVAVVTGGASGIGLGMCRAFASRGMKLAIADLDESALIRAVEECFPRSERGRCLAHRMRNLQSKVPFFDLAL